MLKVKHFRHPLRTLAAARELFTAYLEMAILSARGDARFKEDVRYNLRVVRDGFLPRLSNTDDAAILLRICQAYISTGKGELLAKRAYEPTRWWKQVRQTSLGPVRRALASRDLVALDSMYRNFFRDPCSAGLIGIPFKMKESYLGQPFDERAGRFFLSNALHRIDHWKEQTGNRFDLRDLAGPDVGNPFGVSLEGTLVRSGTESQHYFAQRVADLLPFTIDFHHQVAGNEQRVAVGQALAAERLLESLLPNDVAFQIAFRDALGVEFGNDDAGAVGRHLGIDRRRQILDLPAHLTLGVDFQDAALSSPTIPLLNDDGIPEQMFARVDLRQVYLGGVVLPPGGPGVAALFARFVGFSKRHFRRLVFCQLKENRLRAFALVQASLRQ